MRYDSEFITDTIAKIDLLDYMENDLNFVRRGDKYATHCPFHEDKTPSLMVDIKTNRYRCYSCGRRGDIVNWLRDYEDLNFTEAFQKVMRLAGISAQDASEFEISEVSKILRDAAKRNEKKREDYIHTIISYNDDYLRYPRGYPQEWLDEGITKENCDKYDIRIDEYGHYILYPVYDKQFNYIGRKGRDRLPENIRGRKYRNFHKIGTTDYFAGMKENYETIKEEKRIIIVEGIKSVMKLDNFGYPYSVSAETNYLNQSQIEIILSMGISDVTLAFDKGTPAEKIRECTRLLRKLTNVYTVWDTHNLLQDKDAPVDRGKRVWEILYDDRRRVM